LNPLAGSVIGNMQFIQLLIALRASPSHYELSISERQNNMLDKLPLQWQLSRLRGAGCLNFQCAGGQPIEELPGMVQKNQQVFTFCETRNDPLLFIC
jgi:hypothetical protein